MILFKRELKVLLGELRLVEGVAPERFSEDRLGEFVTRGARLEELLGREEVDSEVPLRVGQGVGGDFLGPAQQELLKEDVYAVNLGLVPRPDVGGDPEGPGVGQFAAQPSDHVKFYLHALLGLEVPEPHLQHRLLEGVTGGHHDGFALILGLLVLGLDFLLFLDYSLYFGVVVGGGDPGDAEIGVGGDGVVDLERLLEGVLVDLGGLDLREVVLDVDEVAVRDDRDRELLPVLQEGVAHEG